MAGPFELSIRQFAIKAGENADQVVRNVVLEIWGRVIVRSPVDTGRFRANWQYSLGETRPGLVAFFGATNSPAPAPSPPFVHPGASQSIHYIHNNLPYARRLEYGYSDKAPAGMVRVTLAEFAGIVDGAAKGLKK